MTEVSGKQRRQEVCFFLVFKDSEEDWRPWTDGVFEKLLPSFVISYVSATTASVSLSYLCIQMAGVYFIFNTHSLILVGRWRIHTVVVVRWRGSQTTVRLRIGGKHKLSNHHLSALPKGLHLWNWWLNKGSRSESCNINTELKRKEGKKHWIMDFSIFKSILLKTQCQQTAGRLSLLLLVMTKLNNLFFNLFWHNSVNAVTRTRLGSLCSFEYINAKCAVTMRLHHDVHTQT